MKYKISQHATSTANGAPMAFVVALVWNALVWGFLMPTSGPAEWFKGVMALAGAGIALFAVLLWLGGRRSAGVSLQLSHDPVPHGVPTRATFTLTRPMKPQNWMLRITIDSPDEELSGFGRVWEQKVATTTVPTLVDGELMVQSIQADFTLPADLPSTEDDFWFVNLVLEGEDWSRAFDIETEPQPTPQPALHRDGGAGSWDALQPAHDALPPSGRPLPTRAPVELPAGLLTAIRWIRRSAYAMAFGVVGWVVWGVVFPMWASHAPDGDSDTPTGPVIGMSDDGGPAISMPADSVQEVGDPPTDVAMDRVQDVGESDASWRLSTQVRTPEFDVLLSNWLSGEGPVRAHLESRTQVNRSKLRMRIQQLALAPQGACKPPQKCQVESIRLILTQADSDGDTTTLAQSEALPWAVDLAKEPLALRHDGILQLTLPENLAGDQDVRLQLVVQMVNPDGHSAFLLSDDTTLAPNGNYMGLQLALRAANPDAKNLMDPCDRVGSLGEAVRAHCEGQVQFRLDSKAFSGRKELDAALIDAIKHYNSAAVRPLLKAGASPNAVDPEQKTFSALLLASFGDQQEVRAILTKAGAKI